MPTPERSDLPQLRLHIPTPPSANNLFTNSATGRSFGRGKSKQYRDWLRDAGWEAKLQSGHAHFARPVAILIEIDLRRQRDMDNAIKPTLDLLVYIGILADDSLVDDLRIVRRGDKTRAAISIWLMP